MIKTVYLSSALLLLTFTSYSQKYLYSAGLGINKSIITLNSISNFDKPSNISGSTSLEVNNTWSFQKKFDSKNAVNWLRYFELSASIHKEIIKNHFVGLKINATEMNQTYTEYPLQWNSEKKFEVAANQMTVNYPVVSTSLCYYYNLFDRFEPNAALSFNKLWYKPESNLFYESNPKNTFFFTFDLGLRVSLIKNMKVYVNYNIGFVPIVEDKLYLLSPTVYGYPAAEFKARNRGNSFHTGLSYTFNKPKSGKKPERKKWLDRNKNNFNTRYTHIDTSTIEVCFYDEAQSDGDAVALYVDDHLLVSNIVTDSTKKCYTVYINKKETVLKIVSLDEGKFPPNTASIAIRSGNKIYENFKYKIDDKNSLKIFLKYEEPE